MISHLINAQYQSLFNYDVWYQVLDALLSELRANRPTERVVIVSNFITSLDAIHVRSDIYILTSIE